MSDTTTLSMCRSGAMTAESDIRAASQKRSARRRAPTLCRMKFGVLGPLEVRDDAGALVDLGGRQPRTLLAMLLASGGRSVSVDAIVDCIWGEDPPQSATGTLHSYVSRLRRRLGADVPLRYDDAGYRLE